MGWTEGQAAPSMDPRRKQAVGTGRAFAEAPSQLARLLLAFNVTVRSDRQGTCQGSHVAQACVGHCESSAFPSRYSVLLASGYRHNITSISQCCTITGLRKVREGAHWERQRTRGSKMAQGRGLEPNPLSHR